MDSTEFLRHAVARSGKSARQVSRDIGRSGTFISTTLGKGSDLSLPTLAAVAEATGYTIYAEGNGERIELG